MLSATQNRETDMSKTDQPISSYGDLQPYLFGPKVGGFDIHVAGVTFPNEDGSDRQKILRKCRPGEILTLRREPENPHSKHAVAVLRNTGEQIGYLPHDKDSKIDTRVSQYLDNGGEATTFVVRVMGGGRGKSLGCLINIVRETYRQQLSQFDQAFREKLKEGDPLVLRPGLRVFSVDVYRRSHHVGFLGEKAIGLHMQRGHKFAASVFKIGPGETKKERERNDYRCVVEVVNLTVKKWSDKAGRKR